MSDSLFMLIAHSPQNSFGPLNEKSGVFYGIRMLLLTSQIGAQHTPVDKSCGLWQLPEGAHHEVYVGFDTCTTILYSYPESIYDSSKRLGMNRPP